MIFSTSERTWRRKKNGWNLP
jgi:hypothetical protein